MDGPDLEPVIDGAATGEDKNLMLTVLSKFVGFIYNVVLYGCLMGACMVGMVYFR